VEAELEAHKGDGKEDGQLEDGKVVGADTPKSMEDGKDIPKDGLRINTTIGLPTSDKRRPGPLDLPDAKKAASPVVAALATCSCHCRYRHKYNILRVITARIQP
jgi:hypothetical protein